MIKNIKKNVEKNLDDVTNTVKNKINSVSKEEVKQGAVEVTEAVVGTGVKVVSGGVMGLLKGIRNQIILTVTIVVVLGVGGCVGSTLIINEISDSDTKVEVTNG